MSMFSYSLLASGGTLAPDSLPGLRPWWPPDHYC